MSFGIQALTKEPNPNSYDIVTISDLMQVATSKNVKRLIADIENLLTTHALLKEALIQNGCTQTEINEITTEKIVWIDD